MTLHRLKVFSAVTEYKSITAAAKKLHMTQPAVSIQLKQLEEHYGISLINIIGKKIYLTEAGKKVYDSYKKVSHELDNLKSDIADLKGSLQGKLQVAVVSTAKYFIPALLGAFHKNHPKIDVQLVVANRQEIIHRLEQNQDDMVILSQLPKKIAIIGQPFLEDSLVIAASPDHPLALKKIVDLKLLEKEHFIVREAGSGTRMAMEKFFHKHHINPHITMELGSSSSIKQAVMAGFGISMLSKMSLKQELALKKLSILNIKHFPVKHPWYIVYLKDKKLSPVAKNFIEFLFKSA
ncbi:MAG: LysR family transcriptional regulator [Gammaproteobacteria bacterium]|nr:LysR family transcriptional regulator [Gammaproteobacteria bacterium]